MTLPAEVWQWFTDPDQWSGPAGIPARTVEHVQLSALAMFVAGVPALTIGVVLGHFRRGGSVAAVIADVGRAIPSFGVLVLMIQVLGIGAGPTLVALVLLAVPPMLTNAYVGVAEVDDEVRDAARGMGMTGWARLRHVELPLASPLVLAGIRTAAVTVVATASLAAVVAWGGLGRFVVDGIAQRDEAETLAGALLVAGLAILTEAVLAGVERLVVPVPLRRSGASVRPAAAGSTDGESRSNPTR